MELDLGKAIDWLSEQDCEEAGEILALLDILMRILASMSDEQRKKILPKA